LKATFARKPLLDAFNTVSSVAPTRSPKPILQNVKLSLRRDDESPAVLVGTDLEVGIRKGVIGVAIERDGDAILPTAKFQQILRTGDGDELTIEVDDDKLIAKTPRARFVLPNEDPSAFPDSIPEFGNDYAILIDADLKTLIRRTAFATDVTTNRYALGGALIEMGESSMTMVATDGKRLAKSTVPAERNGNEYQGAAPIIPLKAMRLIDKALDGNGDQVHVSVKSGTAVMVRSSDAVIYSRLLEGRFPKYQDAFPADPARTVTLEVGPFRSAVEMAAITISEETRGVTFRFNSDGVELSSNSADVGQSKVDLPLLQGGGDEISLTLDPGFVTDALKALELNDPLSVDLIDAKKPAVFRSGETYAYMVMPISRD
jgi:DNA polymerase-3 subunit beta